jgi:hypothetical protein
MRAFATFVALLEPAVASRAHTTMSVHTCFSLDTFLLAQNRAEHVIECAAALHWRAQI